MADNLIEEATDRFEAGMSAEQDLRENWAEDLRFESGDQWPEELLRWRNQPGSSRATLTVNKIQLHVRQVVNDMRQARPAIKVLPVDDAADPETAKILQGLVRNIESVSNASLAYDTAAQTQVAAGIGYWRVVTEMIDEELNWQEPRIVPIWNPFNVVMDPAIEDPSGGDAEWGFIIDDMAVERFKAKYPKAETVDWRDAQGDASMMLWRPEEDVVRVAEYFRLEQTTEDTVYTVDGMAYRAADFERIFSGMMPPPIRGTRERKVKQCRWSKITGAGEIDSEVFPSRFIPIIRAAGIERIVDGKRDVRGLVRDAMDAQRLYNYTLSATAERVALAPKAPWDGPMEAFDGFEDMWQSANTENLPYLPWNHLDANGNPLPRPQRSMPVQAEAGLITLQQQTDADLMAVIGRYEASLGERGDEKSGRAIIARQRAGDLATFHFVDNQARAIRQTGKIILDIIPRLYDTPRIARTLGEDGDPAFARLNPDQATAYQREPDAAGRYTEMYNVHVGKYDVVVDTGPSYATKRQEAADAMMNIAGQNGEFMSAFGDLIFKTMDWPGAEEIAERFKALLPPQVQEMERAKAEGQDQAAGMMQQAMMQMQQQMAPIVEELEQNLMAAGEDNAKLQQALQQAQMQLRDKQAEIQAKMQEAAMKYDADMAKVQVDREKIEADVQVKYIEAMTEGDDDAGQMQGQERQGQGQAIVLRDDGTQQTIAQLAQVVQQLQATQAEHAQMLADNQRVLLEGMAKLAEPKVKQVDIIEGPDGMPVGARVTEVMH